jgi:hypothetical protein
MSLEHFSARPLPQDAGQARLRRRAKNYSRREQEDSIRKQMTEQGVSIGTYVDLSYSREGQERHSYGRVIFDDGKRIQLDSTGKIRLRTIQRIAPRLP